MEKYWFNIVMALIGFSAVVYSKFFAKNDEVLKIIIANQQMQIDALSENTKEDIKQNADDIRELTTLLRTTTGQWGNMAAEYQKERKEMQKNNVLKDGELKVAKEMLEYQKKEFKAHLKAIVDIKNKANA